MPRGKPGLLHRWATRVVRLPFDVLSLQPGWSRYYEIGTDRLIFGDRDKSIHDDVNEISRERRKGYGWFKDSAKRVEQHYTKWARAHPLKKINRREQRRAGIIYCAVIA